MKYIIILCVLSGCATSGASNNVSTYKSLRANIRTTKKEMERIDLEWQKRDYNLKHDTLDHEKNRRIYSAVGYVSFWVGIITSSVIISTAINQRLQAQKKFMSGDRSADNMQQWQDAPSVGIIGGVIGVIGIGLGTTFWVLGN